MSLLIDKYKSDKKKMKAYRVVLLIWEVEPRLGTHKGLLVSDFKSIRTHRRYEKDFRDFSSAVSIFNVLRDRLEEFWNSITLRR